MGGEIGAPHGGGAGGGMEAEQIRDSTRMGALERPPKE